MGIRGGGTIPDDLLQFLDSKSSEIEVVEDDIFAGSIREVFDDANGQGGVGDCGVTCPEMIRSRLRG